MAVTETVEEYENVADPRGCRRWRDDVEVEGGRKIVCCRQARRHGGTDTQESGGMKRSWYSTLLTEAYYTTWTLLIGDLDCARLRATCASNARV